MCVLIKLFVVLFVIYTFIRTNHIFITSFIIAHSELSLNNISRSMLGLSEILVLILYYASLEMLLSIRLIFWRVVYFKMSSIRRSTLPVLSSRVRGCLNHELLCEKSRMVIVSMLELRRLSRTSSPMFSSWSLLSLYYSIPIIMIGGFL